MDPWGILKDPWEEGRSAASSGWKGTQRKAVEVGRIGMANVKLGLQVGRDENREHADWDFGRARENVRRGSFRVSPAAIGLHWTLRWWRIGTAKQPSPSQMQGGPRGQRRTEAEQSGPNVKNRMPVAFQSPHHW